MENYVPQGNNPFPYESAAPVEPKKFCGVCGNELQPAAAFCPKCGSPVPKINADPATEASFSQQPVIKPKKKSKKGLVIGIIVGVLVLALIVIGVLIAVGASGGSSSPEGDVVVGSWNGTLAYVEDEEILVPDGFATAYLNSDHSGTVYVDSDSIEFTWSYDGMDDEGDMIYTLSYDDVDVSAFIYSPDTEDLVIAFDDELIIFFERD